jgi:hypothetical protein
MTINHGLIGSKKGQGDNRFLVIFTYGEYAHADTRFFAFDSYEELQTSGAYNWFMLLYRWVSAVDQESLIEQECGVSPSSRLNLDDWDLSFPKTLEIRRSYRRQAGEPAKWIVDDKILHTPQEIMQLITKRNYTLPIYSKGEVQLAKDGGCKGPKIINDMVNFDLEGWLETPKKPKDMQSFMFTSAHNYQNVNLMNINNQDLNSIYILGNKAFNNKTIGLDLPGPIYDVKERYEDAYSHIGAVITANEIELKTGTSYDDTYSYSIIIKKI